MLILPEDVQPLLVFRASNGPDVGNVNEYRQLMFHDFITRVLALPNPDQYLGILMDGNGQFRMFDEQRAAIVS